MFLIYTNDLPNGLKSSPKPFADNSSLFSTMQNITINSISLKHDLSEISEFAVQCKMNFNPDLFSQKISSNPYITSYFNDNIVHQVQIQKHGGLLLDQKVSLDEHFQCIFTKTCKIIGLIRKLQPVLSRTALLTIYKSFLRLHLGYGDIIYDCVFNESFQNKLESVQCNATLAITGAIRGSS